MMNMDQYCLYTRRISFSAIAFLLVVWQTDSILATETNDCSTCYSFQTVERYWEESNYYCKQMKGNLVSMETEEEYQFINKTIQSLDISQNEWFIGLRKNRTGDWKWISGHTLTIDKWLPGQPRKDGDCVKMIKDYKGLGLFDDVKCTGRHMSICEYKTVQAACTSINKKFCLSRAKTPSTKETTQRTHSYSSATQSTTTISSSTELEQQTKIFNPTTKLKGDANIYQPGSSPFPLVIVTVSLGLVLAVSACLLVFMCYWKRRRNKGDTENEKPRSETTGLPSDALEQSSKNQGPEDGGFAEGVNNVQLFNQNGDHTYVAYAVIHNNLTHQNQGSAVSKEPTYASIQDENTIQRSFQKNCPNDHAMPTATMSAEDSGNSAGMNKSKTEAVYSTVDKSKKNDGSDGKTWSADQQVVYASVDKSSKSKPWTSEDAVYAEVGSKDNSEEEQPSKITYAELADFTNNAAEEAVKPAPCQSAEYAVIIGQKT